MGRTAAAIIILCDMFIMSEEIRNRLREKKKKKRDFSGHLIKQVYYQTFPASPLNVREAAIHAVQLKRIK